MSISPRLVRRPLESQLEKEKPWARIVVTEFISLDGVIEAPGGGEDYEHGGWTFEIERGAEGDEFKLDELVEAEAQLLGRRTYEGFAAAWPTDDRTRPASPRR